MSIANQIKASRRAKAMSQSDLARLVGVSRVAVSQWESGTNYPTYERLKVIADALDMQLASLIIDTIPDHTAPSLQSGPAHAQTAKTAHADGQGSHHPSTQGGAQVAIPNPQEMPRDLPVRGIAACSAADGAFQVEAHTVDYVRRPPALAGIPEAYGIYISGDSMEPKFSQGDLILVHPGRPVRPGDFVVLTIQETPNTDPHAFCKRLVRRHGGVVTVEQYNPSGLRDFPERHVKSMHKVLEMADLFGV